MAGWGRFITIEGGEGVGKSHFAAHFSAQLSARFDSGFTGGTAGIGGGGRRLVVTREPGGTPTADRIRALFASPAPGDPLLPSAEALLVCAARAQHVGRVIRPALTHGDWVLCDRFTDSTLVYQGALGGLPRQELLGLMAFATGGLAPDLTFLLDCDVATALARVHQRSAQPAAAEASAPVARFDQQAAAFHQQLRHAYLDLAAVFSERIVVLDAAQAPAAVVAAALQVVEARFG